MLKKITDSLKTRVSDCRDGVLAPSHFLTFLLFFAPLTWAKVIPTPPVHCQDAWSSHSPEDYLYNFETDSSSNSNLSSLASKSTDPYQTYLDRMKSQGLNRKDCHKTWTVLIYMSASADLVPYAYADLNEMEATPSQSEAAPGSSIRSDVVVHLDTDPIQPARRLHIFPDKNLKFQTLNPAGLSELTENHIQSPVVTLPAKYLPETEAARFRAFLQWGIEEYPSEHYLVLIWGHGQGWTGFGSLDLPSLRGVLSDFREWTGEKIDVFAADACLMQSIEDATELSGQVCYFSGAEGIESYAGLPYGTLLSQLNSGKFDDRPNGEAEWVAWMIPELYKKSFEPGGSQSFLDTKACEDMTSCSVSTKHLQTALIPRLHLLGSNLLQYLAEKPIRWISLKFLIQQGLTFQSGTQDLGLFLKGLKELVSDDSTPAALEILRTIEQLRESINYTIINSAMGSRYPKYDSKKELGSCGLSIWLPHTDLEFNSQIRTYSQSLFYNSDNTSGFPGWTAWMMKMYPQSRSLNRG